MRKEKVENCTQNIDTHTFGWFLHHTHFFSFSFSFSFLRDCVDGCSYVCLSRNYMHDTPLPACVGLFAGNIIFFMLLPTCSCVQFSTRPAYAESRNVLVLWNSLRGNEISLANSHLLTRHLT